MQNKLISIIIPVYNREDTLPRLFDSLLSISYSPLEIILVDNLSTDQSLAVCQDFLNKNHTSDRIIKVGTESRKGACACRNKGTKIAQGSYLYFFDSDDEISPDFITDIIPYCHDGYDMICAPTIMYFENGKKKVRDFIPTPHPYDHILSASLSTQSIVVSKDYLNKTGGWDENLMRWNDWELGVRLLCFPAKIKWLTQKAYHKIYQHKKSISGNSYTSDYKKLFDSILKAQQDIVSSCLEEKEKAISFNALSSKCLLLASHLYKEQSITQEQELYAYAKTLMRGHCFKYFSPIIYFFAKHKLPGAWRLYLMLCKL